MKAFMQHGPLTSVCPCAFTSAILLPKKGRKERKASHETTRQPFQDPRIAMDSQETIRQSDTGETVCPSGQIEHVFCHHLTKFMVDTLNSKPGQAAGPEHYFDRVCDSFADRYPHWAVTFENIRALECIAKEGIHGTAEGSLYDGFLRKESNQLGATKRTTRPRISVAVVLMAMIG